MTRQPAPKSVPGTEFTKIADKPAPELDPLLRRPLRQEPATPVNGVAMGRVLSVTETELWVRVPGFGDADLPARALCTLPEDWQDRECAVLFENGDPAKPLVVGFLLPTLLPIPQTVPDKELTVDGERVVIRADTELELRCGESVILLQRDGRIEIRGNYITSQATATQRLRGGSIHMN